MFSRLNCRSDPNKCAGSPEDGRDRVPESPESHRVTYLGYFSAHYRATAEQKGELDRTDG